MIKVKIDMTGWVMCEHGVSDSRLTIIEQVEDYVDPHGNHRTQWLCECSCPEHNRIKAIGSGLRNGNTLSCGCLRKEVAAQTWKTIFCKTNKYDLSGEYGIGWTTNTNKEFYFDLEDYDKIKDYCWIEHIVGDKFHKLEAHNPSTKQTISMHALLGYKYYDHKDRNELNNRKNNLRKATHQENSCNKSLASNNTSGVSGVCFCTSKNKWIARIGVLGKRIALGHFDDKESAIRARLQAEVKYYGEFAPQTYLFKQYNIINKGELNVNKTTELIMLIDKSGSMSHLADDTIGGFNGFIASQKIRDEKTLLTTVLFDTTWKILHDGVDIHEVKPLTANDYSAYGGTAMLDAIGEIINKVQDRHDELGAEKPDNVLFVITTDGEENSSRTFKKSQIEKMIKHQTNGHGWQFMFLGANMDAVKEAESIGINKDWSLNYTYTPQGVDAVYRTVTTASNAVASGATLDSLNLKNVYTSSLADSATTNVTIKD